MQIYSINKLGYQQSTLKNITLKETEQTVEQDQKEQQEIKKLGYSDLVFRACTSNLIKPQFKKPVQQKISSKIATYLKVLPEKSKLRAPIIMNVDDKIVEFFMDKTGSAGITNVGIKLTEDGYTTSLNMTIDKKGQVKSAAYYEPGGLSTIFDRSVNRMRRIEYGNAYYRPVGDNDNLWTKMILQASDTVYSGLPQRMEFNHSILQEMLSEMAKKSTSFLVK